MDQSLPAELRPFKAVVEASRDAIYHREGRLTVPSRRQAYVNQQMKHFAASLNARLKLNLNPAQLDAMVNESLGTQQQDGGQAVINARALRLVLRHDCQ